MPCAQNCAFQTLPVPNFTVNGVITIICVLYNLEVLNNVSVLICTLTNQMSIATFAHCQMSFEQSDWLIYCANSYTKIAEILVYS